jgi:hypothetical protein
MDPMDAVLVRAREQAFYAIRICERFRIVVLRAGIL